MRSRAVKTLTLIYVVLWFGGVVTYSISTTLSPADGWTASAFLWVAALISLLSSRRPEALKLVIASVLAFAAEVAGVATGLVFGSYQYTGALGFSAFGVPLAISAAWIVLLAYIWHAVSRLRLGRLSGAIVGAAWMTSTDLLIDPLAAGPLSYWQWLNGGVFYGIPFSNFAGWFAISFVLLVFLNQRPLQSTGVKRIGLSVILFFTYIAAINALWIPALIGATLIFVDVRLSFAEWRQSGTYASSFITYLKNSELRHEQ